MMLPSGKQASQTNQPGAQALPKTANRVSNFLFGSSGATLNKARNEKTKAY
jgi:hypothetical protein